MQKPLSQALSKNASRVILLNSISPHLKLKNCRKHPIIAQHVLGGIRLARAKGSSNGNSANGGANLGFEAALWKAADKLRSMVNRILRKYRYPPDEHDRTTETVLQQAELICSGIR